MVVFYVSTLILQLHEVGGLCFIMANIQWKKIFAALFICIWVSREYNGLHVYNNPDMLAHNVLSAIFPL